MQPPRWDDPELTMGSMIRSSLWLLQVVGEGNTFTKNQLREAFPGIAQIDRRIRDLRDYGWVILSSAEDASLLRDDQRFVKAGVPVWDPKTRRAAAPEKGISSKDRAATLARDGYMCTLCGVAGGETYPGDSYQTASLLTVRRPVLDIHGRPIGTVFATECRRCHVGGGQPAARTTDVTDIADRLHPSEQRRLLRWIDAGQRRPMPIDMAWSAYRRLTPEDQKTFRAALAKSADH